MSIGDIWKLRTKLFVVRCCFCPDLGEILADWVSHKFFSVCENNTAYDPVFAGVDLGYRGVISAFLGRKHAIIIVNASGRGTPFVSRENTSIPLYQFRQVCRVDVDVTQSGCDTGIID